MIIQKWGRRAAFFAVTAVLLAAVLVGNLLLTFFLQKNHVQIDLTREPLYTMSEPFQKEIKAIDGDVTITFCEIPTCSWKTWRQELFTIWQWICR